MNVQMMVRAQDPMSSVMAAERALGFAGTHRERILAVLREGDGMTAHEIADATGLTVVQVDRRLPELRQAGMARVCTKDDADVIRAGFRVWEAV